jgi:apolipoprotein N-acyltransferase
VGEKLYSTFTFWRDGKVVSEYHKQTLHILDRVPEWLQTLGRYEPPFFYEAGLLQSPVNVAGASIGSLICSELVNRRAIKTVTKNTLVLLSIGSEAMFIDDTLPTLSLKAAQYRAVEYNLPVIRADALGPSALIDKRGQILNATSWSNETAFEGVISIETRRPTLYARFGDTLLYILFGVVILSALFFKTRTKFLGRTAQ